MASDGGSAGKRHGTYAQLHRASVLRHYRARVVLFPLHCSGYSHLFTSTCALRNKTVSYSLCRKSTVLVLLYSQSCWDSFFCIGMHSTCTLDTVTGDVCSPDKFTKSIDRVNGQINFIV